ncbi:hypothetical protein ACVWZR_002442 [Bradyrhizobium sp. i1.3.1]
MGTHLDAARRLAGPQHDRHGPALLRVIDVDRQEAAFVIMSVEQRELLMAVDDIAGVVDVERDGCRLARVAIHPCIDQGVGQADHVAQARRILQPRQSRLGTQIPVRVRQPTAGELERRIRPQMIEVIGVLVAAADREHPGAEHMDKAVHDPRRIAPIREHPRQIDRQTETPLGHRQKHHAPIRGQAPAIEGCCDFLGLNGWKRERQNRIISHGRRGVRG